MRIYYFSVLYRCASLSVLNICALTSDLFMAQFRHGFASRFHTRSAPIGPLHRGATTKKRPTTERERQREEKLNWIPSIFTDTSCAHTHRSCSPKRVKYATNGTFHQANVDSYRCSMWAPLFFYFFFCLFSFCSVWSFGFLRLNGSPSLAFALALALSVSANLLTLSLRSLLSSKWARAVRNLFIIYYQTFNNTYSRNNTLHVDRRGREQ